MDLELTDEQIWLSEAVDTLLEREWPAPELVGGATDDQARRVWEQLVEFGALSIGGDEGLGALEACLIARALGSHLASVPFLGSAAARLALPPLDALASRDALAPRDTLGPTPTEPLSQTQDAVALALLEPDASWAHEEPATRLERTSTGLELNGEKVAVEHLDLADRIAVLAVNDGELALAFIPADARGVQSHERPSFDPTVPTAAVRFEDTQVSEAMVGPTARIAVDRLTTAGSLLAAAEAIGAAGRMLDEACRYAADRRQFGRPIASFQSLRHILADMYVRQASGWSAVLYAAAAFDDGAEDAAQTASIAKAYVSRGARQLAHDAMQVFGGIAFTDEHPAHRFLRRIVVREQQFGDAAHHERALGRALAQRIEASVG